MIESIAPVQQEAPGKELSRVMSLVLNPTNNHTWFHHRKRLGPTPSQVEGVSVWHGGGPKY